MNLGTTFSYRECQSLGLDPWEALEAVTGLGLSPVRIGTYWDEIEPEKGKYDFSFLDRQAEILTKGKTEIVLELGMKAPRWPEYYLPVWLQDKEINSEEVLDRVLVFLERVVKKYGKNPQVKWLNVENEPLNYSGPNDKRIASATLKKEIGLVGRLSGKPVILNSWVEMHPRRRFLRKVLRGEKAVDCCLEWGDILGLSLYPKYPGSPLIKDHHWLFLKGILKKAKDLKKQVWVTELQASPWEEKRKSSIFSPSDIIDYFNQLKSLGFSTILFWGAEFWYQQLKEGNQKWWQLVKNLREENE
jgi:hypothetical protein